MVRIKRHLNNNSIIIIVILCKFKYNKVEASNKITRHPTFAIRLIRHDPQVFHEDHRGLFETRKVAAYLKIT